MLVGVYFNMASTCVDTYDNSIFIIISSCNNQIAFIFKIWKFMVFQAMNITMLF